MLYFVFVDYIMIRGFSLCIELILEAEASVPPKCALAARHTAKFERTCRCITCLRASPIADSQLKPLQNGAVRSEGAQ